MVIDRESNFVPIPVELRRFLGVNFPKYCFLGPGWGGALIFI